MRTLPIVVVLMSLLGTLACGSPATPQPKPNNQAANKATAPTKTAPAAPAKPAVAEPPTEPSAPEPPVAPEPAVVEPVAEPEAPVEPAPAPVEASTGWTAPAGVDIRSDAAVPPGTPATNAEAFKRLPASKADGPPVSAIASNGLHFDSLVVGRGWEKSRCVEADSTFTFGEDDRVSICVRAVHPADVEESLTVEWTKAGTSTTRRSSITIKAMHAYLTRSYLPIKSASYAGEWKATIKAPDGTVLTERTFTIE